MSDARAPRRLLFLLPSSPRLDATHGGARSAAQFLRALAPRHRVAVLHLRAPDEPPADPLVREACAVVEEVARPAPPPSRIGRWRHRARLLAGQLRGRPIWATDWAVPRFAERARALARAWAPDVVQVEHHVMGQYLRALAGCAAPRILTEHEPGTASARDHWRAERGVARGVRGLDLLAWQSFEWAILRDVQAVVVLTERDRRALAPLAGETPVVRIPVGVCVPPRPLDPLGREPPSVVFVGNFAHPPNVDAARRLATAIMPRVRKRCPDALLLLVGDEPPAGICELADGHTVVTGRVLDVTPYLDRAGVVAAPLRMGGGMRVKVLDALAAGKALVASPLAVSGLDVRDGREFLRAETDWELVEAIASLLDDPARRADLANRARAWSIRNLGWDTTMAAYERLYCSLLARHQ